MRLVNTNLYILLVFVMYLFGFLFLYCHSLHSAPDSLFSKSKKSKRKKAASGKDSGKHRTGGVSSI